MASLPEYTEMVRSVLNAPLPPPKARSRRAKGGPLQLAEEADELNSADEDPTERGMGFAGHRLGHTGLGVDDGEVDEPPERKGVAHTAR